jgi:hypothetical protein
VNASTTLTALTKGDFPVSGNLDYAPYKERLLFRSRQFRLTIYTATTTILSFSGGADAPQQWRAVLVASRAGSKSTCTRVF